MIVDSDSLIERVRKGIKAEGSCAVFYDGITLYSRRPSSKKFGILNKRVGVFTSESTDSDIINKCCEHISSYQKRKTAQSRLLNETLGLDS